MDKKSDFGPLEIAMVLGLLYVGVSTCSYQNEKNRPKPTPLPPSVSTPYKPLPRVPSEVLRDESGTEYLCRWSTSSDKLICE
jgi:hypothetical protein